MKEIIVGESKCRQRHILVRDPREVERQKKKREDILGTLQEEIAAFRNLPQ